ncbi:UDP-N-acetylmuramate--L-alanine ligase [Serpentinicella sp. ANB-PHB4]|uniref:UDP-N-acetylmuramate--L-alanine ligase n=1 Tax=Serpentinicella sp. ANB-PHB4 TaxID=3074076 RepID=UPI002F404DB5
MSNFDISEHKIKHIHLIGIGGISMSAIAEILLHHGYQVSGSDLTDSKTTVRLRDKGAQIFIGHEKSHVHSPDLIVYNAAIKEHNPERVAGMEKGIPQTTRAQMLGQLMKKYNKSIAVSGSHGKTTTTSFISLLMAYAKLDPTILVGGDLKEIGGNVKIGNTEHFITEACEYVESFLQFFPFIGIILNIDVDHLDYFKDLDHIKSAFNKFAHQIPAEGFLVANWDDTNVKDVTVDLNCNLITYSIHSNSDFQARDIVFNEDGHPSFYVVHSNKQYGPFQLSVPGMHNVYNALAAITTLFTLGIEPNALVEPIQKFNGIQRRFDFIGEVNNIKIVDDYAHHPVEIKATLEAAKNYSHNKLWCVFQPHTYSRTKALLNDFSTSFSLADHVIITDIYAAREPDTGEVSSKDLADRIVPNENVVYIPEFETISTYLSKNVQPGDMVITMGAGNVFEIGEMLKSKLNA